MFDVVVLMKMVTLQLRASVEADLMRTASDLLLFDTWCYDLMFSLSG